ncbi:MAG: hypothetical protein K2H82_00450 [Oscillospiraceae bacterium]|nr:hypothetical protein [Oscillospiraceae bacterium]
MDFEKYFDKKAITGRVQRAIAAETAQALKQFCEQEQEFAQAIEQSGKSFQDCLDAVAKNAGQSISDFKAYSQAAKFYFPGATVHFRMEIDLIGDADAVAPAQNGTRTLSAVFHNLTDW